VITSCAVKTIYIINGTAITKAAAVQYCTLYINDLANLQLSECSKLVAYADDLLLYKPVESNNAD